MFLRRQGFHRERERFKLAISRAKLERLFAGVARINSTASFTAISFPAIGNRLPCPRSLCGVTTDTAVSHCASVFAPGLYCRVSRPRFAERKEFDVSGTTAWDRVRESGFVSGRSTHADRIRTIRRIHEDYGTLIDPHTADGVHVGCALRLADVPLVCLETALPVKFAATIREAVGFDAPMPAAYANLDSKPQHFTALPADEARVKSFISAHARTAS